MRILRVLRRDPGRDREERLIFRDNYREGILDAEQMRVFVDKYEAWLETGEHPRGAKIVCKNTLGGEEPVEVLYDFNLCLQVILDDVKEN